MVLNGDFTPTKCGDITPTIIRIELESETPIVGMTQVISRSGNKKGGSGYNPSYKMLQAG